MSEALAKRTYFIDLPIYSMSQEKYDALIEKQVHKHFDLCFGSHGGIEAARKIAPEVVYNMEPRIRTKHSQPWLFNSVFGWLRLYTTPPVDYRENGGSLNGHISGDLWKYIGTRFTIKTVNKRYSPVTLAEYPNGAYFGLSISSDKTNDEIQSLLKAEIAKVTIDGTFKNRIVDTSHLDVIGPHLDWRSLLGF